MKQLISGLRSLAVAVAIFVTFGSTIAQAATFSIGDYTLAFSGIWLVCGYGSEPYELSMSTRSRPLELGGISDLRALYDILRASQHAAEHQGKEPMKAALVSSAELPL